MNWYRVTVRGHVDRFGVDKTVEQFMHTNCAWTRTALADALATNATQDGISNLEITEFRPTDAPPASWGVKVVDLDALLGI